MNLKVLLTAPTFALEVFEMLSQLFLLRSLNTGWSNITAFQFVILIDFTFLTLKSEILMDMYENANFLKIDLCT